LTAAAASLFLLGSLAVGVFLAEIRIHVPRKPLGPAPPGMQYVALRTRDDVVLRAWFSSSLQPNGDAVILLHGVADNREGVLGYAELFRQKGYAVLLPDARGHGLSEGIASYGLKEAGDVHEWGDWLAQQVHPRCLFGLGESMGAAILLQSLATEPRFCAVVAESPFSDFRDAAYDQTARFVGAGPWLGATLFRPAIDMGLIYARFRYGLVLEDASPRDAVARTRTPVLLIHGLSDVNLRPYQSHLIMRSRADRQSIELWEVPGAAHCGARSVASSEFDRRVLNWFGAARPTVSQASK
jgi:pimeloyl-ACP methyl ester carboxylesterase